MSPATHPASYGGENPVVLAARRHAEAVAWAQAVGPVLWTPASATGSPENDPSVVLAIVGALWAGQWLGIATSWDGDSLRGGVGLIERIAAVEAAALNKDDLVLVDHRRGRLRATPGHGALGFWAGRIDALRIWTTNAKATAGARDPLDRPSYGDASATGYDEDAVSDPRRDGFALSAHASIRSGARPARELLAYLGAAWLGSRRRGPRALSSRELVMPQLAGVPISDMADLRRAWAQGALVSARVDRIGEYRRVLRGSYFLPPIQRNATWREALRATARQRLHALWEVEEDLLDADSPRLDLRRRLARVRGPGKARQGRPAKTAPTVGAALARIEADVRKRIQQAKRVQRAEARIGLPALAD